MERWRKKSLILAVADIVPSSIYYSLTKKLLGSGSINLSQGVPDAWEFIGDCVTRVGARKTIEFGGGRHLGINLWLSKLGIEQTVIDINPIASVELINDALKQLIALGDLPAQEPITSLDDLPARFNVRYIAPQDLLDLPDEAAYDANITSSVWEHIPREVVPHLLTKLRRIVKPGGHVIAHVDYSDHYSHSDGEIDRLNFLSMSEVEWRKHNHRHLYQSRLRHAHYRQLFQESRFEVLQELTSTYVEAPKYPCRPELLTGEDTDFATTGRWLLRNPA